MSNQILEINWFSNGIINDQTAQVGNGFFDMSGIDIFTDDWVAQINFRMEQDTTSWLTSNVLSFTTFDGKTVAWTEDEEIRVNDTWTTWTLLFTSTRTWDNDDITTYQDHLIFASNDKFWRSVDTTIAWWFTDNPTTWAWGNTFTNGTSSDNHFFKGFNNRLYISDWNVLAELDWASAPTAPNTWVFTPSKFVLPVNEKIKSLEEIGSQLAIWTLSGNFYLWDWASANASQIIKSNLWGIQAMIEIENTLFVFAWKTGTIYKYTWSDFTPDQQIPNMNISNTSFVRKPWVRKYKNWLIFVLPWNWIFVYNRIDNKKSFVLNRYWNLSNGVVVNASLSSIFSIFIFDVNLNLFFIWYASSWDKIDRTSASNRYRLEEAWASDTTVAPFIETVIYQVRNSKWKPTRVQWVQAQFDWPTASTNNLLVEFRTNTQDSYTTLWKIWSWWWIDVEKVLRWISRRLDTIQFRFKTWWNFASTTDNTRLILVKLF